MFRNVEEMVSRYAGRARVCLGHPSLVSMGDDVLFDLHSAEVQRALEFLMYPALKWAISDEILQRKLVVPTLPRGEGYAQDALAGYAPKEMTLEIVSGDTSDAVLSTRSAVSAGLVVRLLLGIVSREAYLVTLEERFPHLVGAEKARLALREVDRVFVVTEICSV